jgi:LuxR family transcriptional regulator, maltose regulon positive regulatory protein
MLTPILATKLYIPRHRPETVSRPILIERLNEGLCQNQGLGQNPGFGRKLTLVSAPAGFGKTTLVSEWLAGCKQPVVWLSLDEGDNNFTCFLTYLIAALQTVAPEIGKGVLGALQSPQPPPTESILTTLLNEIANNPDNFLVVLDDYHVLDAKPIDDAVTFLIEHLPPQMHLVIATREDPHLPLARLRVRGHLTELRAADLRFSPTETAEFLNQVMSLNLSIENISKLEDRTEGWIAGLQLAALSMQGRKDITSFIKSFTGSHRFVLDYLVEEVLQHQSEHTRSFLLQTAILDRFCAPLCNAVNEREDGKEMLDALEGSNLFLIPLGDQRQWYRYHHLFADMLQAHLIEAQPEQVSSLHRRASAWYEQNGLPPDAIRHALAAKDFEYAAGLIELAWSAMDLSYQSSTWLGWAKALPDELIRARPVLSAGYAWALLDGGELEASEVRLQDAERCLDIPTDKMIVVDKVQFRSLPASIATARAYRSLALGNIPGTVKYAQQALKLTLEDDHVRHNQATSLLGLALYTSGDLEAAELSLSEFHTTLRKTGEIETLSGITFLLAEIRVALGRLNAAESIYQQSLRLATSRGGTMPLGTADLYRGLAEISIERGDLQTAAQHLLTSQKLGEQTPVTDWPHRLYVSQARLEEAQGDLDGALSLLDEAERVYIRGPLPDVRPVAALKARIWLKQGRLAEALGWVREQALSVNDDIHYLREFEYITLARVLIAAGKSDRATDFLREATQLLGRLLKAAETSGQLGSAIQILLLRALAFQAQGNLHEARESLKRAMVLAESEGYIRTFVDEGEALRLLIEKQSLNLDHPLSSYAEKLLAAFKQQEAGPKPAPIHQKPNLIEPLSERELEVLKLLRSELNGPEIAQHLIVSLNTFRTHTKSIFNKLGVNKRRAAIRRADELGLF